MRNRIGAIWKWGTAACAITCMLVSVSAAQQKIALKASHLNKQDSVIGIAFDRMADLINKNGGALKAAVGMKRSRPARGRRILTPPVRRSA